MRMLGAARLVAVVRDVGEGRRGLIAIGFAAVQRATIPGDHRLFVTDRRPIFARSDRPCRLYGKVVTFPGRGPMTRFTVPFPAVGGMRRGTAAH